MRHIFFIIIINRYFFTIIFAYQELGFSLFYFVLFYSFLFRFNQLRIIFFNSLIFSLHLHSFSIFFYKFSYSFCFLFSSLYFYLCSFSSSFCFSYLIFIFIHSPFYLLSLFFIDLAINLLLELAIQGIVHSLI